MANIGGTEHNIITYVSSRDSGTKKLKTAKPISGKSGKVEILGTKTNQLSEARPELRSSSNKKKIEE